MNRSAKYLVDLPSGDRDRLEEIRESGVCSF
jgi:hypothetical protein